MIMRKIFNSITLTCLALMLFASSSQRVFAQGDNQPSQSSKAQTRDDEINLDTQLYLLVGTDQDVGDAKLPAALDPVIKQLRASLPFRNYRLAATLINRVKTDGRLILKWIAGPLVASSAVTTASTPSFNEFSVGRVRL